MFYSHELLTDRQHGVATIWLVATLGSRSNLKTVSRKAIVDINVSKACETITNPAAPLALRLQASLLYGVSRVHAHQCGYMLSDMLSFKDRINRAEAQLEIDPHIGKMRSEHLNLPEDPLFMPELDIGFDLNAFDCLSYGGSDLATQEQRGASSLGLLTSEDEPGPGPGPGLFALRRSVDDHFEPNVGGLLSSVMESGSHAGAGEEMMPMMIEESPIIDDPGFEIADDGSIVPVPPRDDLVRPQVAMSPFGSIRGSDISRRTVRTGGQGSDTADNEAVGGFDDNYSMLFDDIEPLLPSARPFSPLPVAPGWNEPGQEHQHQHQHQQTDLPFIPSSSPPTTTTTTANAAPQQHARKAKRWAQIDARAELTNAELRQWTNDYLAHMASVTRHKKQYGSAAQAKKTAAFWILGQGVGGVEILFGQDRTDHPLSVFSGQGLLDALRGRSASQLPPPPSPPSSPTSSKRAHTPTANDDEDQESRRVRAKMSDVVENDEEVMVPDEEDDMRIESEIGRHAPSSLPDRPSVMPWNMSGSRQGSAVSRLFGSAGGAGAGGGGGVTGILPPHTVSRRGSRLTSASPLLGKGRHSRLPSLDIHGGSDLDMGLGLGSDVDNFNADDLAMPSVSDHFDLYEASVSRIDEKQSRTDAPAAATSSGWPTNTAMEDEALNFLDFLDTKITEHGVEDEDQVAGNRNKEKKKSSITLDELVPPEDNTSVVGAQALLHVLTLVTKGMVKVEQKEPWEDIRLWVVL